MNAHKDSTFGGRQLAAIFILLALGIIAAGVLYYTRERDSITKDKQMSLMGIAELKVSQIADWRDGRLADAAVVSENLIVAARAQSFLQNPRDTLLKQSLSAWMHSRQRNYKYESIFLFDSTGALRLSVFSEGETIASTTYDLVHEAVRTRQVVFGDLQLDVTTGDIDLDIAAPLVQVRKSDSACVGVFIFRINPYVFLYPLVQSLQWPSRTAETIIFERDDDSVLCLTPMRHRPNAALRFRLPIGKDSLPMARAARGFEGITEGIDYRGKEVVAAALSIPASPWFLMAKMDVEEIQSPIRERAWAIAAFAALLISFAGASVGFVWRGQQTHFYQRQYSSELERRALIQHFEYLTKYANDIIILIDDQLHVVEANERALSALGYSREEILHLGLKDILDPKTVQDIPLRIKQLEERNGTISENRYRRKDGTTFPVEVSSRVITIEGKKYYQGIVRDVTERKRAEEALMESEQRHRSLFENMLDGYAYCKMLFDQDKPQDFIYIDVNNAFEQLTGLKNVVGKKVTEVIPGIKESNPELLEIYARVALTGKPETFETYLESLGIWFSIAVYSPRKEYFVAVFDNITERKKAEEALRSAEQKYRGIFDNACEGIYQSTPEGRFITVNPAFARMLGYDNVSEIMSTVSSIADQIYADKTQRLELKRLLEQQGYVNALEAELIRKDGSTIWVSESGRAVKDATGSLLFYEGMVQDITERKRVEEALKESEKLLRESQVMAGLGSYALDITTGTWKSSVVLDDIFGIDAHFIRSVEGWASLIHPEHRESLVAYLTNEVIGKSTRFDKQYSIVRHNDRQERWVHGLGELEFDAQHRPIKMIGTIQDITERKRAEEALRESEKKLKALFEALPVGVSILDAERRIAYINPALEKILGITKDGLIRGDYKRRKYLRSDNTQMLDEEFASMRAIREQRAVHDVETGVVKEDGHVIWTNVNAVPVAFPDWQVVIVTTDITERKQGEEALKSSEEWQRAILGASLDGIVVEDEEMIVFANDAFARLYGYKNARELVGKHVSIVQSHEDNERMLEYGARRMRGEQVPAQYEFKGKRKDGTAIDVEASVSTATIQGQQHVITVVRDITMRKQAEEKLRQLSLAVEQSPTSIVITDTHGAIEYVNAKFSQISGYAFEEVQGKNSRILKSGETALEEYKHLWDEITSGREWRGEFHNRRKNGDLYWESASISPITNAEGKIAHFLAVKEDITERKALEHQLRQVQKLESIGTLAGGIAHDFNNILGIIIGHAGLLRRLGADPDRLAKSVDAIHTAVERGAGLARQVLTFARKTDVLFEPVSINDLVTEIVTMMGETFPKTITIEHQLEPNLPSVNADRTQIHQTLLNLCVNARDAMPGSGTVSIATARVAPAVLRGRFPSVGDADYLCMSVSDTGMGMDEATKQRIFEPFFTTKEKGKGTGLGLAVVYGIMQSHDGFIDVRSAPGKGTTFTLYFPIPFHREMLDKTTEQKLEDVPGGSETLLIIEDEEMLRQLLRMVLEAKGYKVLTAVDGEEGLAMYQLHRREITLILSDIGLPKLGGDDVFLNLKRLNPKVKVILASGYIDPEVKSKLIEAGANIFIQKPYVPFEILKSIREEIERRND